MQYPDEAPTFDGRPDPNAFIDWVHEMNRFFDWHKLSDDRKMRFAKLKLTSRAKFFWQSTEAQRRKPITDWTEMIEVLSNKYILHSYQDRLASMEQQKNLEAMQKSKNQIIEVLEQIENISNELREIKTKMQQFKKETNAAIIIQTHWRCHKIQRTKEARHRADPDGEALLRRRSRPVGGHCEATTRAVECQGSTTWPVGGKASDDEVCPTPIEASARSYEVCRRFDKRRRGLSEIRRGLSEVQRACFYRYASVFVGNAFLMRSGCVSVALLRKKRRFAVFLGDPPPLYAIPAIKIPTISLATPNEFIFNFRWRSSFIHGEEVDCGRGRFDVYAFGVDVDLLGRM
ncbi:RING/FYVE/PHD zinc finger superfamily protein [Actinidia rufa]|uniref:RING/FYVE/PHD zinc finger superfamily protein n=1 Tax=Actinidia rufa TaxID=165716 RepID=A0A7J0DM95_9ERIC|nr:RING/FYVE/PHD zinc finger superfamily protein [Actinidia rufa]